jgi:hypothetical protein
MKFYENKPAGYYDNVRHERLKYLLKNATRIMDISFYKTFAKVVFLKDWKHGEFGIMDKTHLRFFIGKSIKSMYSDLNYHVIRHEPINTTKSLKPILFNIPLLFSHMDIRQLQYATVASVK